MKTYYFYHHQQCIARFEAGSMIDAINKAEAAKLFPEHYESVTDFYIPEPRTTGEVLDDTLAAGLTAAHRCITATRKGVGSLLGKMAKAVTPSS